jgi:hypothetical protein
MRPPSSTSCAEGKNTNTNGAPLIDGTVVWSCEGPCEKPGGAIAPVDGDRAAGQYGTQASSHGGERPNVDVMLENLHRIALGRLKETMK